VSTEDVRIALANVRSVIADYERITQTEGIDSAPAGRAFADLRRLEARLAEEVHAEKNARAAYMNEKTLRERDTDRLEARLARLERIEADVTTFADYCEAHSQGRDKGWFADYEIAKRLRETLAFAATEEGVEQT